MNTLQKIWLHKRSTTFSERLKKNRQIEVSYICWKGRKHYKSVQKWHRQNLRCWNKVQSIPIQTLIGATIVVVFIALSSWAFVKSFKR